MDSGTLVCGGHINLAHAYFANDQAGVSFINYNFSFLSVNEPYIFEGKITGFDADREIYICGENPRAELVIDKKIKAVELLNTRDIVIINALINEDSIILISLYCSPNEELEDVLDILDDYINRYQNKKLLIMGDFNAKSSVWGGDANDARGDQLFELIIKYDLRIDSDSLRGPTFNCSRGTSYVDIILSKNMESLVVDIDDAISNSDHELLIIKFTELKEVEVRSKRMTLDHLDPWVVMSKIRTITEGAQSLENISCKIDKIQSEIWGKFMPVGKVHKHPRKSWWTQELMIMRKRVRAFRRRYQSVDGNDSLVYVEI